MFCAEDAGPRNPRVEHERQEVPPVSSVPASQRNFGADELTTGGRKDYSDEEIKETE